MKLRILAVFAWLLAASFVSFLSPNLEKNQWNQLVGGFQSARVSFKVLAGPVEATGFNGKAQKQVKIQLLEPSYATAKTGRLTFQENELRSGDKVEAVLSFRPSKSSQFSFNSSLKYLIRKVGGSEPSFVEQLRSSFQKAIRAVSVDSGALVSGLAIGDDSKLSSNAKQDFQTVSLTHLTAVSGANCAIVLGAISLLIYQFPMRRVLRVGLSLAAVAGYLLLVGQEPSVLRASAMVSVILVGLALGRRVSPIDALALSVILVLSFDPKLALSFGFTLSVLATLGLLVLAPKLYEKWSVKLPNWLAAALAVTVSAQIACLPVLLMLQPKIPVYSVLANLLAEPLVAPITVLGLIGCLISTPLPALAGLITLLASIPAELIVFIAKYLASAPYASLNWFAGIWGLLLGVLFAASMFGLFASKTRKLKGVSAFTSVTIGCLFLLQSSATVVANSSFYSRPMTLINCDVGQGDALVIRSAGKVAVVDVGREDPAIDNCLSRLHISTIDLLVLTHFDMDHVGGVVGAVSGRRVKQALITSFSDDRPGANFAENYLEGLSIPIAKAEKGMSGHLGEFSWSVLSPHRGAPEAEDSNDGSISMKWQDSQLVLFTLADLGEKGQLRIGQEQPELFQPSSAGLPVVVKVAHHGSADQASELYEAMHADLALISVGQGNSYGHPTRRCLAMLEGLATRILRTDQQGAIGVEESAEGLRLWSAGRS